MLSGRLVPWSGTAVKYVWTLPMLLCLPANCNVIEMPLCFDEVDVGCGIVHCSLYFCG